MSDLETTLLSHLINPQAIDYVWNHGLRATTFVDPINRKQFEFCLQYWLDSSMTQAPTIFVITEEFPKFEFVRPDETVSWLTEKLQERYIKNELEDSLKRTAGFLGGDEPLKAAHALYEQSWMLIQDVTPRLARADMSLNTQQRRDRYALKANGLDVLGGVPLGFPEIDQFTNGLLPGELAALVGFAKVGKSQVLAHTAVELRRAGITPYVATLELDISVFEERIDAHASGVSYSALQRGQLDQDQVKKLRESQDEMAALGPLHVERPGRGQRTAQALVTRARQLGCGAILIDQLAPWMEARGDHRDTKDKITEIVSDLREVISEPEHPIPCFLAVQFNRSSKDGKRPSMEHIALSASIEQTVDIAYGIVQTEEMRLNKSIELMIMGSRRTGTGAWLLSWLFDNRTEVKVREMTNGQV